VLFLLHLCDSAFKVCLFDFTDFSTLPDSPNHPSTLFKFPDHEFGKKHIVKRSRQSSWFPKWKWLHYNEDDDVAFCHLCVTALVTNKIKWNKGESTFVSRGYSNWKDVIMAFKKHEGLDCHRNALEAIVTLPSQCQDIGEQFIQAMSR